MNTTEADKWCTWALESTAKNEPAAITTARATLATALYMREIRDLLAVQVDKINRFVP